MPAPRLAARRAHPGLGPPAQVPEQVARGPARARRQPGEPAPRGPTRPDGPPAPAAGRRRPQPERGLPEPQSGRQPGQPESARRLRARRARSGHELLQDQSGGLAVLVQEQPRHQPELPAEQGADPGSAQPGAGPQLAQGEHGTGPEPPQPALQDQVRIRSTAIFLGKNDRCTRVLRVIITHDRFGYEHGYAYTVEWQFIFM